MAFAFFAFDVLAAHPVSLDRAHADGMIDLGTVGGLFERRHELHAYCRLCDRWRVLDLAALVAGGSGARRLPLRVRCSTCGALGQLQVRPPMPARASSGWITPPVPLAIVAPATNRVGDAARTLGASAH